jgi:pimeloyl-ACP methyl ester carboxylesterase
MIRELESARAGPQKFIPSGFGPHAELARYIPEFARGPNYYDLTSDEEFEGLLSSMKFQFQETLKAAGGLRPGMKRLIMFVPGLMGGKPKWEPLKARLQQEPELAGSDWCFWHHHILRSAGFRRAEAAARELKATIDEKCSGGGYADVVLIGHSMGGLLVRQAYLMASGYQTGLRSLWQPLVSKIVLFAASNRGLDPRRRLKIIGPIAGPLLLRTGCYARLPFSDFLWGSDFITNMRIHWLRIFGA